MAFEDIPNRRAPDGVAEFEQLALQLAWRRRSPRLDSLELAAVVTLQVQDR
jgi:hypothetical protein